MKYIAILLFPLLLLSSDAEYDKAIKMFEEGQIKPAFKIIERLANEGHNESQCNLYDLYQSGYENIIPQDQKKAKFWLEKCATENPTAMTIIGRELYIQNKFSEAKQWLEKAEKKSDTGAMTLLGNMFWQGQGVKEDCSRGFQYYKKAAENGNGVGAYILSTVYGNGMPCVKKDQKKAKYWLEKSASAESYPSPDALAVLGMGQLYGNPNMQIKIDYKKSEVNLKKAVEYGHIKAMIVLGGEYVNGNIFKKDDKKAFELFSTAAKSNDPMGVYMLGTAYANGVGVSKDLSRSCDLYEQSLDFVGSVYYLATCYDNGEGRKENRRKAFKYYQQAADQDYIEAFIMLAMHYDFNNSGNKDHRKAEYWYLQYIKNLNYNELDRKKQKNYAIANYNLSILYKYSNELSHDLKKSLHYLKESAKLGFAPAQNDLGAYYVDVERNPQKAKPWYKKAAAQSNENAIRNLKILNNGGN